MKNWILLCSFCLIGCGHRLEKHPQATIEKSGITFKFDSEVTLELFIIPFDENLSCQTLENNPKEIPTHLQPASTVKADNFNDSEELIFSAEHLNSKLRHTLFVRAIDMDTNTVHATACAEHVQVSSKHITDVHLYLKVIHAHR